jgi:hypothetical protein
MVIALPRAYAAPPEHTMPQDSLFRWIMCGGVAVVLPIALFYRIRSQATRERLDRQQEGLFILLTLRPVALARA